MTYRSIWLKILFVLFANQFLHADYSYSYIPKFVYSTQHFAVTVVDSSGDTENNISFRFDQENSIKPLSKAPIRDLSGGKVFYTFYFKAGDVDFEIPKLTITDENGSTTLESRFIPVRFLDASKNKNFCGLIASNCKLISSQVSEFDGHSNLISMVFKATEANPEYIHINDASESGIEKLDEKGAEAVVEYYFVLPSSKKSITLSYYNTLQNRFIPKTISTDYREKTVAAQEELNPKDSGFEKIKKYGLILLLMFLFWMFWLHKDIFFLVIFVLVAIVLFGIYKPKGTICIQEGAPLYIIPTENSTTSFRVPDQTTANILNQRGEYYKVNLKNNIIGWIKNEDLCEN